MAWRSTWLSPELPVEVTLLTRRVSKSQQKKRGESKSSKSRNLFSSRMPRRSRVSITKLPRSFSKNLSLLPLLQLSIFLSLRFPVPHRHSKISKGSPRLRINLKHVPHSSTNLRMSQFLFELFRSKLLQSKLLNSRYLRKRLFSKLDLFP